MSRSLVKLVAIQANPRLLHKVPQTMNLIPLARCLNTTALSPTITLISNAPTKHLRNVPDLSKFNSEGRPLSILICWLMAKNNAVKKYAQFYLEQGYDVLTVRITPGQLLLPARVEPIVRSEIFPTLLSSNHDRKLIHGFSVGGYVFARTLKYLQEHPEGEQIIRTLKAQIWDSVVDVNGVSIGVSKSLFVKNKMLQKAMENYIEFHMRAFYNFATKYYFEAHDTYYYNPLKAPALFLASEIDQISTMDVVTTLQKEWQKVGIATTHHQWKNTQHVGHMRAYPEEYKSAVRKFLHSSGLPSGRIESPVVREELPDHAIPHVVYSN